MHPNCWTTGIGSFARPGTYSLEAFDPDTGDPLNVTFIAVPEPSALTALGLLLIAAAQRRTV